MPRLSADAVAPIALSCGEPAGVGPEIAAKAWVQLGPDVPFFLVGDPDHVAAHSPDTPIEVVAAPDQAREAARTGLPVLPLRFDGALTPGKPNPSHASTVVDAIARAVDLARTGQASAVCTAPIHKKALQDGAGFAFPGHTEFLAHLAGDVPVVMMLACPELRVVPATIHIPISDVPAALTPDLLRSVVMLTHSALQRDFGVKAPRLALAGLNPHAGEGGKIGTEEADWIDAFAEEIRASGINLTGPHSADTMFHAGARRLYDAAIAMYHDQALIPIKTIDFAGGVNVTLGLPFIRTSPDHGTALDIAGQGRADPTSLIASLRMAADMAVARAH
ncbi:4-hydroxythreonine-4-phosphate dehydrogenase PdxA [Tropicimonas sp. S265A]|uniref:4-hydroxythreonine-4-phosphate dehydrogenase PdxA n=1 Tax=Tropicimonas sp. S265A TaxID=3415134 RepID=UPI003C7E39B4